MDAVYPAVRHLPQLRLVELNPPPWFAEVERWHAGVLHLAVRPFSPSGMMVPTGAAERGRDARFAFAVIAHHLSTTQPSRVCIEQRLNKPDQLCLGVVVEHLAASL